MKALVPWVVLALVGCSKAEPETSTAKPESKKKVVTIDAALAASGRVGTVRAEKKPRGGVVVATGQVEAPPDGAAAITSPIAARVKEIRARRGDAVKKGDTLAVLDAGEVARVRGELARAKARRVHAERVLAQEEKLVLEKATSERAVSDAKSALETARADERAAQGLLSSYGAGTGAALVLRAPITGTVVSVDGVLGAPVEASAPLFRIVDEKRLVARADVPESEADSVPEGAPATVSVRGRPHDCKASVESHAPRVDEATRTVPFRVRLGTDCGDFHDGAFVDITIERKTKDEKSLVVLPRDAVVSVDEVPMVFVGTPREGEFEPRNVRVAEYAGARVFLEEGVNEGESVVVAGSLLLKGELMRSRLE